MADGKKPLMQHQEKTLGDETEIGTSVKFTGRPLYDLCNSPALQRSTSFKSFYSSSIGSMVAAGNTLRGKVRQLCSIFEDPNTSVRSPDSLSLSKSSKNLLTAPGSSALSPKSIIFTQPGCLFRLPGTEDRVVVYFTSLRGIRKTFQDCQSIRMIFRGLRVNLDERDISMDIGYRKELQRVLGEANVCLPQVFIKGKYIGGADVIRQLHENDELVRLIKGLPLMPSKPCEACDGIRFIPCTNCDGSRKVYDEDEEQPRRCIECNENGLVKCPLCCL